MMEIMIILWAIVTFSFPSLCAMDSDDAVHHHYYKQASKEEIHDLNELIHINVMVVYCLLQPHSDETRKYLDKLKRDLCISKKQLIKRLATNTIGDQKKQYQAYCRAFHHRFKHDQELHNDRALISSFIETKKKYDRLVYLNQK
jgi:hypothetical protein